MTSSLSSAVIVASILAPPSHADVIKIINTGFDDAALTQLANHTPDTDYVIGLGGTGGHIGVTPQVRSDPIPPTYLGDGASSDSRWLVIGDPLGGTGISVSPGSYFFDINVDLTDFIESSAQITSLRYAADNQVLSVSVGGTTLFSQPGGGVSIKEFLDWHVLGDLGLGDFLPGVNTLRFEVENDINTGITAMGLRVEGVVEATPISGPGPPFGPPFEPPPFGPPFGEPPFGPPVGEPPFGPPFAPHGDGNLNGVVEAADYTIWANGFGGASPQFTDGDYNVDGSVDAADYTTWANNFSQSILAAQSAAAAAPEPSTFVLTVMGLIGLFTYGWRRRRRT